MEFCEDSIKLVNDYREIYQNQAITENRVIPTTDTNSDSVLGVTTTLRNPEFYSVYITEDIKLDKNMTISGNVVMPANVDLNGHTLTINGNLTQTGGRMKLYSGYSTA